MIKKVIVGLILLICICSGAFSVIFYYNPTNSSDIDNADSSSIIENTNNEVIKPIENNPLMKYIDHVDDTLQYSYGYVVNVNGELRHYINNYGVYYLESEGLTDRYISCVECGGFHPIGEITNPLPKAAICHHDNVNVLAPNYKDFSYSRDEAYNLWVEYGKPVFDEFHLSNFTNSESKLLHFDGIYCIDCDGYVILKNYDWYKRIHSDFFTNYGSVLNEFDIYALHEEDMHRCSHYNGTLDLFNANIEDFHQGWFRSTEWYNHWLGVANKSLNENNTSIDNNVNETVSSADKNIIDDVVYHEDNETYIDDFNQDFDNEKPLDKYVEDYAPDNKVEIIDLFDNCWVGS